MNNPGSDSYRDNPGERTRRRNKAHPKQMIEKQKQPCAAKQKED
jgi:hypothetical protein